MLKVLTLSRSVELSLQIKAQIYVADAAEHLAVTADTLKVVYRRGAHSFSPTDTPSATRGQWAMKRVDAFLVLLRMGDAENPRYTSDFDLLPHAHQRSTQALTASAMDTGQHLDVTLKDAYAAPEEAILALTEYMGLGYEAEPAVRASWMRAVRDGESPYQRALSMAQYTFESKDADLLPRP
jgi:hypothetical protein